MKEPKLLCEMKIRNAGLTQTEFDSLCDELQKTEYYGCDYRGYERDLPDEDKWCASKSYRDGDKAEFDAMYSDMSACVELYLKKINKVGSVSISTIYYDEL